MTRLATLVLISAFAFLSGAAFAPSFAQTDTQQKDLQQKIEDALKPKTEPGKPLTRGLTRSIAADPKTDAERQFIQGLRTRFIAIEPTQPVAREERDRIAELVKDKPKIDLKIYFDYNSAAIGPKAVPAVNALGATLAKPDFKGGMFIVNGHTDAAGSAEYNQGLSERRAQAVRRYLIERFNLPPDALIAAGFGKEQLKFPQNPLADRNRRVQIVNATQ